jgi:hypothetical protein
MKLALKVSELGDGLSGLFKDTERSRKQVSWSLGLIKLVKICGIPTCKTLTGNGACID